MINAKELSNPVVSIAQWTVDSGQWTVVESAGVEGGQTDQSSVVTEKLHHHHHHQSQQDWTSSDVSKLSWLVAKSVKRCVNTSKKCLLNFNEIARLKSLQVLSRHSD